MLQKGEKIIDNKLETISNLFEDKEITILNINNAESLEMLK